MPFEKGRSGNPRGRPKGSRNRATIIAQALIDREGESIARKAVDMALAGDVTCLRMCLERLVAPRKDSPIRVDLGSEADVKANSAVSAFTVRYGIPFFFVGDRPTAELYTYEILSKFLREQMQASQQIVLATYRQMCGRQRTNLL